VIYTMQIYELIIIFLVGAGLGVIARYIMGYRRKSSPYVVFNILLGGMACVFCHLLWGSNTYSVFLSGVGGVIFNFLFSVYRLVF
ncbi:MAG: hypothetical protein K2O31_01905, partial [Clostridia bacterium]|nr:hypothetical protein [Clostridia bacterium]